MIIDKDDIERVSLFKWRLNKTTGYMYCRLDRKTILLHRFIMGADSFSDKVVVDHKNRNRLDNRKSNLRITSYLLNNQNKGMDKRNKSGYTGIKKTKYNTYRVCIGCKGKLIDLGTHKTLPKAIKIRKDAEKRYWK